MGIEEITLRIDSKYGYKGQRITVSDRAAAQIVIDENILIAALGVELNIQTIAFANPLVIDGKVYKDWRCASMTGNSNINLINVLHGDAGIIILVINNVGGYAITPGGMFTKNVGGGTIDTTANKENIIAWFKFETDIYYSISQV